MIGFSHASSSIGPADLDEVEKRFGFKFPPDLRDLYLRFNGGRPDKDCFADGDRVSVINVFLPIKDAIARIGTLEQSIQRIKVDLNLIPSHLVQFAIDPFGNYYCFSTRESDFGAVYVYRMDTRRKPKDAADFLAASFGKFMERLITRDELEHRGGIAGQMRFLQGPADSRE